MAMAEKGFKFLVSQFDLLFIKDIRATISEMWSFELICPNLQQNALGFEKATFGVQSASHDV